MIIIAPYDEEWPIEFARIAADLRRELGGQALRIDHIGSTSVPGLAAKDILDIQITVEDLEGPYVATLERMGYTVRSGIAEDHRPPLAEGPDSDWQKRLFRPPAGQRPTNLHVRAAGRPNQRYPLLFRDYLRVHPAAAAAYATLKRRLALVCGSDINSYTDAKDPACDLIAVAAEAWAAQIFWQLGPPDA